MDKPIELEVEQLEERIAPSQPPGLLGYEGQPGNQGGHGGNGNNNPVPNGATPEPAGN
jgi:hypothetical protein